MSRVVVIGAGLAGLTAACHLVGRGHEVTVLEREDGPGGRARSVTRDGFTFDLGPVVMTMPQLVESALAAAGSSLADLPMRRLDPAYRGVFADGSEILVRYGHDAMREEIREKSGEKDAANFDSFVAWLKQLYDVEMGNFIDKNFDSALGLVEKPTAGLTLLRLRALGKLGPAVRRYFDDTRLHRLFTFQALYAGLPPETALSLYAVITYMDSIEGVWFPDGGMGAIPAALERAAKGAGVEFRYGTTVTGLTCRPGGAVAGVVVGDDVVPADAVVATPDLPIVYDQWLADVAPPRAVRKGTYSPSAVVWHVGAKGRPVPHTEHHNIHFGDQWNESFDALMGSKTLQPDPSRLVTVPTLSEPGMAPEDHSTLYVLEPVPNLQGPLDWRREAGPMRDRLHAFLGANGYPTEVVAEEFVTPLDWQAQGMAHGTPFALAHTFAQTGPFRPSNVEKRVPGLVFAGSGTIPGVGVPMVLVSGKLAADRVDVYTRGRRR